jgi:hypothetical protein
MGRQRLPRGNCLACGAALDRRDKRYCDVSCQHTHAYRRFVADWLNGRLSSAGNPRWSTVSDHIRRYLFELQGCCAICGWAERHPVTGRIPLHIDHIDGDWRNNRPDNLRLLCPNCHALTPSYGSLNRGKGRPYHMVKRTPTI